METPLEFKKNVKKGIVTDEMLGEIIFSYNKRAKNMRDKEREYRHYWRYDKYNNEEKYRDMKEWYYECKDDMLGFLKPIKIHHNSYGEYFLYYETANRSFHHPIKCPSDYEGLEIEDIGELETFGKDTNELLSVQFCDKVRKNLLDGKLTLVKSAA